METGGKSSSIPSLSDWDTPLTPQQLQEIEAVFQSATSSSASSNKRHASSSDDGVDRRINLRRMPDSIAGGSCLRSEGSPMRFSNSFSLSPCTGNRFYNLFHSASNAKLMRYPTMKFGGRIVYSRTIAEVDTAAKELLKIVETKKRETGQVILGFDIEWRPTFMRGVSTGKAAVMQLCGDTNYCYVMHIIHSGIPQNLQSLLEDSTSVKVGVGIGNDAIKLFKDYNISVKALEDLSRLANQKLGGDPKIRSLGSLAEMLISKQLQKPNKIRLGNWEADILSKEQLQYAATDAYASWYIYEVLKSLPDTAADNKSEELGGVTPERSIMSHNTFEHHHETLEENNISHSAR